MYNSVSVTGGWPVYRIRAAYENGLFVELSSVCFSLKRTFKLLEIRCLEGLLSAKSGHSTVFDIAILRAAFGQK